MNRNVFIASLVAAFLLVSGVQAQPKVVTIKGSDTMVNLGASWAEAYMKLHPGVRISVTGGGSGTGVAALLNRTTDIAQVSREMGSKEVAHARARGVRAFRIAVAMDGLAVVVHKSNPIKSLTMEQLAAIYTGRITDWKQLGGKAGKIFCISRESNSGTHVLFKEVVLGNGNYRPDALMLPSTMAIQMEVERTPRAIGYGGEAYFQGRSNLKILPISIGGGAKAIFPSEANVQSGKYPISRALNFYTNGKPQGVVMSFIRYCKSPAGQKIVRLVGFVPLKVGGKP